MGFRRIGAIGASRILIFRARFGEVLGFAGRWDRFKTATKKIVCVFYTFAPFWFNRIIVYFAAFASTLPLPLLRRPSALALLQDLGLALLPDGLPACIADVLFAQLSRRCWPGLER